MKTPLCMVSPIGDGTPSVMGKGLSGDLAAALAAKLDAAGEKDLSMTQLKQCAGATG
jgi:hypothetical protein